MPTRLVKFQVETDLALFLKDANSEILGKWNKVRVSQEHDFLERVKD